MKKITKKILLIALCAAMLLPLWGCAGISGSAPELSFENGKFPVFTAKDFEGREYSEKLFADNAVTVLNLWFTGCKACVQEMPDLEKLSREWANKNVKLLGICFDAGSKEADEEAMKILKANGVTYPNLTVQPGEASDKFMNSVMAFPTTLLIDRQGNVVGEPIVGSMNPQFIEELNKRIDDIIAKDTK